MVGLTAQVLHAMVGLVQKRNRAGCWAAGLRLRGGGRASRRDSSVGVLDRPPDGRGRPVLEQVGQRPCQDGNVTQEGSQRQVSGSRTQGTDPDLHTGRASAIQDEQQPGEERVVPPPLLRRRGTRGRDASAGAEPMMSRTGRAVCVADTAAGADLMTRGVRVSWLSPGRLRWRGAEATRNAASGRTPSAASAEAAAQPERQIAATPTTATPACTRPASRSRHTPKLPQPNSPANWPTSTAAPQAPGPTSSAAHDSTPKTDPRRSTEGCFRHLALRDWGRWATGVLLLVRRQQQTAQGRDHFKKSAQDPCGPADGGHHHCVPADTVWLAGGCRLGRLTHQLVDTGGGTST